MPGESTVHYLCMGCGHEFDVDGPPVNVRTCRECGGEARPDRPGRTCAKCDGTIVTEDCLLTETDGSQLRVCVDCGAHGVRWFTFDDGGDAVAGPVYDGWEPPVAVTDLVEDWRTNAVTTETEHARLTWEQAADELEAVVDG